MRILLTNDDGIDARGLALLESVAARLSDDLWVVAPSEEQSGTGHSLTLTQPVRCRQGLGDYRRPPIVERTDPRGFPEFCVGLAPTVETPGHQTDLESIAEGYVSVTPLHLDLTFEPSMAALRDQFA